MNYKGERIDGGNYATVYNGYIRKESESVKHKVAWKISNIRNADNAVLLKELKTLSMPALAHENICQMLMHVNLKGFLAIALEFCDNGSLKHELDRLRNGDYKIKIIDEYNTMDQSFIKMKLNELLPTLLRWCIEIAGGMDHLEKLSIVHADLSAKNVLLDASSTAKVADFGLSCRMYKNLSTEQPGELEIAWPWAAYESLTRREFSSKSDVWSFGMTLVEMFSIGNHPIPATCSYKKFVDLLQKDGDLKVPWQCTTTTHKYTP